MKLTRAEFERLYAENSLRIALVGMSNIGKSYTAMRLTSAFDFKLIEVDKLIREKLGKGSMEDFAAWQGQPYSEGYGEREAESISLETNATATALNHNSGNAVLDTTGSVIYTSKEVQEALSSRWYIVHISASDEAVENLQIQYFENPKPLIWNGFYRADKGQSPNEAILASYPKLLKSRVNAYESLADTTVSSNTILNPALTIEDIFERLKPTA